MSSLTPLPHRSCPLCGGDNNCAPAKQGTFNVDCWCNAVNINPEALARLSPEHRNKVCLCSGCAGGGFSEDPNGQGKQGR